MIQNVYIVVICLALFNYHSFAQDILKSKGKAQMVLNDDISKEALKEKLRMEAKINAIEGQFGSVIEQESRVEINENGTFFNIVGDRYLNGEWLKTTREKFSEEYRKAGKGKNSRLEIWVTCEIEGLIREISKPAINFEFTTTNCPDKLCRTTDFLDGESMYLFFKTPVDGFLTVYSVEEDDAFRILPYQQMPMDFQQHLPVTADNEYLFFSTDDKHDFYEDFSPGFADELIMTTEQEEEYLYLYILFSTRAFLKPTLEHSYVNNENEYIVPSSLGREEFESWLSENRIRNEDFYFRKVRLKINR